MRCLSDKPHVHTHFLLRNEKTRTARRPSSYTSVRTVFVQNRTDHYPVPGTGCVPCVSRLPPVSYLSFYRLRPLLFSFALPVPHGRPVPVRGLSRPARSLAGARSTHTRRRPSITCPPTSQRTHKLKCTVHHGTLLASNVRSFSVDTAPLCCQSVSHARSRLMLAPLLAHRNWASLRIRVRFGSSTRVSPPRLMDCAHGAYTLSLCGPMCCTSAMQAVRSSMRRGRR